MVQLLQMTSNCSLFLCLYYIVLLSTIHENMMLLALIPSIFWSNLTPFVCKRASSLSNFSSVFCSKCPPSILSFCSSTLPSPQRRSSSTWTAKRWQRSQSRRPTTSRWRAMKCLARWSNQEVERGSPLQ